MFQDNTPPHHSCAVRINDFSNFLRRLFKSFYLRSNAIVLEISNQYENKKIIFCREKSMLKYFQPLLFFCFQILKLWQRRFLSMFSVQSSCVKIFFQHGHVCPSYIFDPQGNFFLKQSSREWLFIFSLSSLRLHEVFCITYVNSLSLNL